MRKALLLGAIPYLAMIVGIPFVNSTRVVLGLPLIALWICLCVLVSPVFLGLAARQFPSGEEDQ